VTWHELSIRSYPASRDARAGRAVLASVLDMSVAALRLAGISLDCADPVALASFYRDLLAGTALWSNLDSAGVEVDGAVLVTQRVSDYVRPTWPGTSLVHLDVAAGTDLEASVAFAVTLGAERSTYQPDGRWCVLIDPAGHPFCITTVTP
jgi:hypothetical protein